MSGDPVAGLSQRLPPTNIQAEQALLGALLANNKAYERVQAFLRAEHFADPIHGRIYAAIAARIDAGRMADAVTLTSEFENSGILDEVGGTKYLAQLLTAMVGIINAGEYGHAIRDCWHRRELIDIGEQLINGAFGAEPGFSAKDVHEQAEARLFALGEKGEAEEAISPLHEAMGMAIDVAAKASQRTGGLVGVPTGLRELDDITGGLLPASMNILGGRPSMGKTTLALTCVIGAAEAGVDVLLVSREMDRAAIGAQMVAGIAGLPRDIAERGKQRGRDLVGRFTWTPASQADFDRMTAAQHAMIPPSEADVAAGRAKKLGRVMVDECRAGTIAAIRTSARRMMRRGGLGLIVVDYLGILRVPELAKIGNPTLEIERLSGGLKELAKELGVPVLVLVQLSRQVEQREDKRPILPDLRQSGAIEQDADVVAFIYRDEYYLRRAEPARREGESSEALANRQTRWGEQLQAATGRAEVIIAKQRRGRVGTVHIAYDPVTTWFRDLEE